MSNSFFQGAALHWLRAW